jgi:hypothetical protein
MLTRVDPAFDGPVILFQDVIEVLHRSVLAVLLQNTLVFELHNRRRVSGMLVGVDDSRHGMVLPSQRFGQKALCCGRVLLGREEKVEGRAGRIHRTIQVAPLALDRMYVSSTRHASLVGLKCRRKRRSISGA